MAFGPLHERGRRHCRRAPASRPRERGEAPGPQPLQHILLKNEVWQAPEQGPQQRGRGRIAWRRGSHRIWRRGVPQGCCGACVGVDDGGGGSRGTCGYLCRRAHPSLMAFLLGNPALLPAYSQWSSVLERVSPGRHRIWGAVGVEGVRDGCGGAGRWRRRRRRSGSRRRAKTSVAFVPSWVTTAGHPRPGSLQAGIEVKSFHSIPFQFLGSSFNPPPRLPLPLLEPC